MKTNIKTFCSLLADFTFEGKGSAIVAHLLYQKTKKKSHLIRKTFQVYRINLFSAEGDWKYSSFYSNTRVCDYNPNNNVDIGAKKKSSTQRIQKRHLRISFHKHTDHMSTAQ